MTTRVLALALIAIRGERAVCFGAGRDHPGSGDPPA